jgi:hypothetical protein
VKERLASLAFAACAFALFWMLFLPKPALPTDAAGKPLSTDAGKDGLLALERWLAGDALKAGAIRQRFDEAGALPPGTGNLLIIMMPHAVGLTFEERQKLDQWIGRGNTLLVMASLDDTPRWTLGIDQELVDDLARLVRIRFSVIETDADATPAKPATPNAAGALDDAVGSVEGSLLPVVGDSIFRGVTSIATVSELPASRWRARAMDIAPMLELARRRDTGDAAVWWKAFNGGQVIISAYASPFTNAALGKADNARWFANIVRIAVRAGGHVAFDDFHQGSSAGYNGDAFFADPRLHLTLWWLLALWLIFVVATPPFRPAPAHRPALDDAAFLRTATGFFANSLVPAVAARRLLEHFFNDLRRRLGLREDGAPVWDWLAQQARISSADLDALRALQERAAAGRRLNLNALHNLLLKISGKLT